MTNTRHIHKEQKYDSCQNCRTRSDIDLFVFCLNNKMKTANKFAVDSRQQ